MAPIPDVSLANIAVSAGWRGDDAITAVAVALAESGGDPSKLGDVALENAVWGPSVGLWQIRSKVIDKGTGGLRDEVANMNAVTNGMHAHQIWAASGGFLPWSAFMNQSYRLFLPRAKAAVENKTVNDDGSVSGHTTPKTVTVADAAFNFVAATLHAGEWMANPHNWLRVALALIGGALVVGGLLVTTKVAVKGVIS